MSEPLRRAISGRMLIVFVIGDILGAGIYTLVGKLSGHVGGMVWLPLAIGFVAAALTAASYAELVGKYPKAAGAALYAHRAFGRPFLTFVIAFAVMMSGIASAAAASVAFGGNYLQQLADAPWWAAAAAFIVIVTLINFIGISESIKVNLAFTIVEVLGLLIVIVVGVIGIAQGNSEPARAFELDAPAGALFGIAGATALGFYALLGFEDSVNLAEETEQPHRTFPRALFVGLLVTGVIYLAVAFIAVALVEPSVLAGSSGPLLKVVTAAGVSFPPELFAVIALIAICNTALINMIMASRLLYGMANEGVVPRVFARVHQRRKTPYIAIAFTLAIAGGLIAIGRDVEILAATCTFLLLLVFATVNVALIVLRRRPVEHPHFKAPAWAPWCGAAVTLALASPLADRDWRIYAIAIGLVAVGALLWLVRYLITGKRITTLDAEQLVK